MTHVTELPIELCVHGCHVYDSIWVAAVGEELPGEYEARNTEEMLYVFLLPGHHDGKLSPLIVVGSQLFVDCTHCQD